MHALLLRLAHFFISLGVPGMFLLSALDSSFLFFPLGNDLLVTLFTVNHHERMLLYVAVVTAGSTIGVAITDLVARKGGEEGLKGRVSERRLAYVQRQVEKRAWLMLGLASLMPPPFPFTVFIIVASALQYPRWKLLSIVAAARLTRFLIIGTLALRFGDRILRMAQTPVVQGIVLAIMVVSLAGSAWSIWGWIKRSRRRPA